MSKYYVCMTDKFMSGWGMAKGKTNKLVLECDSYEEALIVEEKARNRKEMKYININIKKPYYNEKYYLTSFHNKKDYTNWYER